ncbi:8-oxo-dGTP diphosphatase [Haladaptatus litoreus]|uniref:Oxidized purine nucleoside triphosphate hydrolase n=1 Tax=Haladaptatus litoreus TaxID=553468 RepID=A0A1N6VTA7_9EURY|nr:8-oxo-dGTP diphosphatase [Haladaptatus litoreus]SIQ81064.1 8-oxo-dGTP diphosphatase [Haladaptatus litoreus]
MQPATLCYPIRNERVLLIRKKRGLGEGKYVGPGGKIEDGETPQETVIREVEEEIHVTVAAPTKVGEFEFVFGNEPKMFVHVFRAEEFSGVPQETPEADPRWFDFKNVPYDEMWEDDRLWMPHLFSGVTFSGCFQFDSEGEQMVEHELVTGVDF